MLPKPLVLALSAVALCGAVYAGMRPVGPLPPLGGLLDPVSGVWGTAGNALLPRNATVAIPGLEGTVDVRYDDRGVPHIFATTEEDAYRALGYVVARDRLFQLDIQTRAASGRLTELVGARALELDETPRFLEMPRAAEQKLAAVDPKSESRRFLDAYASGVNAYIDSLKPRDYPIEYKLLNARPERWHSINSIHLLNRMGWTLASANPDHMLVRAAALVGDSAARSVFPQHTPIEEPIQPQPGWTAPHDRFETIVAPGAPDRDAIALSSLYRRFRTDDPGAESQPAFASNNWAVSPARTKNGYALLAGDPHLELTLPSIWYEVHLVVPGKLDIYGVTIPGAPAVVIGFNRDVSWTFTNTAADVMDFYRETVDDSINPARYRLDGQWRPLARRIEQYRDQSGRVIHTDTVRYTHRGPMTNEHGHWVSMRWTVLDPSNEIQALYDASHARNTHEFQDLVSRSFLAPAQNMLVADRHGSIAIRSTGHFPIRAGDGDGETIRDGSTSASDWRGFWPIDRYPQSFDPKQGFLASANQEPEAPEAEFGYLGADHGYEVWRALRINQLLRADSQVTPDDMIRWQTDPGSTRADRFVPYFIAAAKTERARGRSNAALDSAAMLLAQWDRTYALDNQRAVLFEAAMRELSDRTWDELNQNGARVATPSTAVLAELLTQPANAWWDDRRTRSVTEDRDDILAQSLAAAYDSVTKKYGAPDAGGWRWDRIRFANIYHLLHIPAFSALRIPVPGGTGTLTPSTGTGQYGPSWRMVVEMGPEVHAWGTFPGGQSGNPMSPRYRDHLAFWERGKLQPLIFPRTSAELPASATSATLELRPVK
ncbi:MAG TPA: penicillin acylase family protein [Gemmatimonadaceae bacterium]|nr:penicillin acylase family protein [Gemmatimonadaceae bacterium]